MVVRRWRAGAGAGARKGGGGVCAQRDLCARASVCVCGAQANVPELECLQNRYATTNHLGFTSEGAMAVRRREECARDPLPDRCNAKKHPPPPESVEVERACRRPGLV